jgi:hypothetical protein
MRNSFWLSLTFCMAACSSNASTPSSDTCDTVSSATEAICTPAADGSVPTVHWECRYSEYKDAQYRTCGGGSCTNENISVGESCAGGSLYYCDSLQNPRRIKCANSCTRGPNGTDDSCE